MLSTHVIGSSSGVKPEFDEPMSEREPTQGPWIPLSFSTHTFNNIISQMPEHPVLNIDCQSRDAIHDSLNFLFHWTLSKKAQNPEISGQYIATLLVTGLTGLANEWWRWLPQRVRDDILNSDDADQQLLKSLAS